MACGCNNACGCNIIAGAGLIVQRIGDDFYVSRGVNSSESFTVSDTISASTEIVVYSGGPGEALELPPALAGRELQVWNVGDDVDLDAAVGETVNGVATVTVPLGYTADLVSILDGEWLANVH